MGVFLLEGMKIFIPYKMIRLLAPTPYHCAFIRSAGFSRFVLEPPRTHYEASNLKCPDLDRTLSSFYFF